MLQQHIPMINYRIKTKTALSERLYLFLSLFKRLCIPKNSNDNENENKNGNDNSNLVTVTHIVDWMVKELESNFWGIEHYDKMKSCIEKGFSNYNQMNLQCVKYLLKNKKILISIIKSFDIEMCVNDDKLHSNLAQYFAAYKSKCESVAYFVNDHELGYENEDKNKNKIKRKRKMTVHKQ